jgi:phosphoribosylformimino-5-aminoimidazole carboxamide ribonucleotide (ProFAR) isomerase
LIVPSIDILGGRAVQLRGGKPQGGKYPVLDVGDPEEVAERYSRVGEIAVVDLDAALGSGSNGDIVMRIARRFPCRVGGGLRSKEAILRYLDAGARAVMLGTKAEPEFLAGLPRDTSIR